MEKPVTLPRKSSVMPPLRSPVRERPSSESGSIRQSVKFSPHKSPIRFHGVRAGGVNAHDLQGALLLVLALYASVAILNLGTELHALAEHWQTFLEFLLTGLL